MISLTGRGLSVYVQSGTECEILGCLAAGWRDVALLCGLHESDRCNWLHSYGLCAAPIPVDQGLQAKGILVSALPLSIQALNTSDSPI